MSQGSAALVHADDGVRVVFSLFSSPEILQEPILSADKATQC